MIKLSNEGNGAKISHDQFIQATVGSRILNSIVDADKVSHRIRIARLNPHDNAGTSQYWNAFYAATTANDYESAQSRLKAGDNLFEDGLFLAKQADQLTSARES